MSKKNYNRSSLQLLAVKNERELMRGGFKPDSINQYEFVWFTARIVVCRKNLNVDQKMTKKTFLQ